MDRRTATIWTDPQEPTLLLVEHDGRIFYAEECAMRPPRQDLERLTLQEVEDRHWQPESAQTTADILPFRRMTPA